MTESDRGACPAWCRTPDAEHAQDEPGAWLHEGPAFGLVRTWLFDTDAPVFSATLADGSGVEELGADDLRRLATDALDAAMWMDRQSRSLPQPHDRMVSVVDLVRRAHDQSSRSA